MSSCTDKTEASVSGAFELASFETTVSHEVLPAVKWSIQKYEVAQMIALMGLKKTEIAKQTKVPLATINNWLKNSEFSDYINKLALESVNVLKAKRIQLLTKMLDARIEEAEDENGGYAKLSRKDTLDIIKELRDETEEAEKKQESSYTKLLEKILLNSTPPKVVDITPAP